jgi:hypothetical protein
MVSTRIEGRVTSCTLNSGNMASSFKEVRWRERKDRVQPQTTANTIVPAGWFQGHRWVDVEFTFLGEVREFLKGGTPIYNESGDNVVLTSCAVVFTNSLGSSMIMTFNSPIIDTVDFGIRDYEPATTIVAMKAYWVGYPALT